MFRSPPALCFHNSKHSTYPQDGPEKMSESLVYMLVSHAGVLIPRLTVHLQVVLCVYVGMVAILLGISYRAGA